MAFWTVCGSLKLPKLQKSTDTRVPPLLFSPIEPRSLTGSEAGLLLPLGEVGVRVEVGLQGRRVDGFTPAFPFDQMGHSALSHGRGFGHMVLDYLGNPCRGRKSRRLWRWKLWCAGTLVLTVEGGSCQCGDLLNGESSS